MRGALGSRSARLLALLRSPFGGSRPLGAHPLTPPRFFLLLLGFCNNVQMWYARSVMRGVNRPPRTPAIGRAPARPNLLSRFSVATLIAFSLSAAF